MRYIGLLSDTHGYVHPKVLTFFEKCNEIWHAGDIGDCNVIDSNWAEKEIKAVYGNIDGTEARIRFPKYQIFLCENVKVVMTHIGGYPGRYEKEAKEIIMSEKPMLFISGHSHILKVIYDKKFDLLHLNPGAAGKNGLHNSITALRFKIDGSEIKEMEILDISRNKSIPEAFHSQH